MDALHGPVAGHSRSRASVTACLRRDTGPRRSISSWPPLGVQQDYRVTAAAHRHARPGDAIGVLLPFSPSAAIRVPGCRAARVNGGCQPVAGAHTRIARLTAEDAAAAGVGAAPVGEARLRPGRGLMLQLASRWRIAGPLRLRPVRFSIRFMLRERTGSVSTPQRASHEANPGQLKVTLWAPNRQVSGTRSERVAEPKGRTRVIRGSRPPRQVGAARTTSRPRSHR